jgi:hypothetical protein
MRASAQLKLAGSDSWEPVIDTAFIFDGTRSAGADLGSFLGYAGGGQTPGETALKNYPATSNQTIAVFTAQLTDTGSGSLCATYPNAQDIVIGIDGLINIGEPTHFAGAQPTINTALGSWQNTLSILYTGYDLVAATQDCNGATRRALASDYASLFTSSSIPANTPIKHVFRRGDASATSKLFLQLLGIPSAKRTYCNGTDSQDLDPIRRQADANDQVAEFDGTLGLVLSVLVPTFSNNLTDLYLGADGTKPSAFGKFLGGQSPACAAGPSSTDISTAGPGVAATTYAGLAAPVPATLTNTPRCDCRFPVPSNFADPTSADAKRFNWNVKLGIGCQGAQASTSPAWNVLNGDDGTRENTPAGWGTRVSTTLAPLPTAQRCCNVGSPLTFRREDPRLLNLFLRDPATGNLKPSNTAPALAFYRLATTNKGLSNVGKTFTSRCVQTIASDLQLSCLVTGVPGQIDSIGYGALPVYKDVTSAGLAQPTAFNLNTDPIANSFATIRDRSYGFSRYVFISSLLGFSSLGESATADTHSLSTFDYIGSVASGTTGTLVQQQVDAQFNLAKALYADSRRPDSSNAAVEKYGFLALNPGVDPYAVPCSLDANDPTVATKIALNNSTYFLK